MSCEGLAMVDSGGGQLSVEGLEGNASLLSGGGDVKVSQQPMIACSVDVLCTV